MDKEMPIENYLAIIREALSRVETGYYRLRTTYAEAGVVRERVFCYELYHQMRSIMGAAQPLIIHAEIDKSGHADFEAADQRNPDFVFHVPGEHERNTLVVEVKGTLDSVAGVLKDFETLERFVTGYGYRAGVFILYNYSLDDLLRRRVFRKALSVMQDSPVANSIYILATPQHGVVTDPCLLSLLGV
jgi:hypothetical protein